MVKVIPLSPARQGLFSVSLHKWHPIVFDSQGSMQVLHHSWCLSQRRFTGPMVACSISASHPVWLAAVPCILTHNRLQEFLTPPFRNQIQAYHILRISGVSGFHCTGSELSGTYEVTFLFLLLGSLLAALASCIGCSRLEFHDHSNSS